MSVVVSIQEVGPCRKRLTVAVPPAAVAAETERVAEEFRRRAKLPGFRQGKVPLDLVRTRFRAGIEEEVIDRLVPRYWRQAESESNLDPLLPPRVEQVELHAESELTFVATVETRPDIRLGNIGDFELPEFVVEPAPEEVDGALSDLRRGVAEWRPVERAAADGDRAEVELTEMTAGAMPAPRTILVEVGAREVWEELSAALRGLMAGQQAELARMEWGGGEARERRFRVRVVAVSERVMPPLDDALAARLGHADLTGLRQGLEQRLRRARADERRRRRERALLDQWRARHPVALPEGVVERETELLLREYAEGLSRQGVDLDKAGIDWGRLAGEVHPQAERRVHDRLLLDRVAEEASLAPSEEEFERALAVIARAESRTTVAVRQALDASGKLGDLRAQLRREKALRHLLKDDSREPDPGAPPGVAEAGSGGG